jgi:hypothetical protein
MTLILEDPAFAAVGNLQVEVAAIGVAALTTNAAYEGGRKLVPGRITYPEPYPGSSR